MYAHICVHILCIIYVYTIFRLWFACIPIDSFGVCVGCLAQPVICVNTVYFKCVLVDICVF